MRALALSALTILGVLLTNNVSAQRSWDFPDLDLKMGIKWGQLSCTEVPWVQRLDRQYYGGGTESTFVSFDGQRSKNLVTEFKTVPQEIRLEIGFNGFKNYLEFQWPTDRQFHFHGRFPHDWILPSSQFTFAHNEEGSAVSKLLIPPKHWEGRELPPFFIVNYVSPNDLVSEIANYSNSSARQKKRVDSFRFNSPGYLYDESKRWIVVDRELLTGESTRGNLVIRHAFEVSPILLKCERKE